MSTQTVILFGIESDPAIQKTKARIEALGRAVEIRDEHAMLFTDLEQLTNLCGHHFCNCAEPCRSIHRKDQLQ